MIKKTIICIVCLKEKEEFVTQMCKECSDKMDIIIEGDEE